MFRSDRSGWVCNMLQHGPPGWPSDPSVGVVGIHPANAVGDDIEAGWVGWVIMSKVTRGSRYSCC